jgi:hypothetical protein
MAEARHFLARMLWSGHRARQALETMEMKTAAFVLSGAIRAVESVAELLLDYQSH